MILCVLCLIFYLPGKNDIFPPCSQATRVAQCDWRCELTYVITCSIYFCPGLCRHGFPAATRLQTACVRPLHLGHTSHRSGCWPLQLTVKLETQFENLSDRYLCLSFVRPARPTIVGRAWIWLDFGSVGFGRCDSTVEGAAKWRIRGKH